MYFADATSADGPEIAHLVNEAYRRPGATPGWTDERQLIEGSRTDEAMVEGDLRSGRVLALRRTAGGSIVACLSISVAENGTWYLSSIAVQPAQQAAGIGRALLAEVERQAIQAKAPALRMTVIQLRTALIAWYERRGFRRTGVLAPFPYDDPRVGTPLRTDLSLVVLEKPLRTDPDQVDDRLGLRKINPDRSSAP